MMTPVKCSSTAWDVHLPQDHPYLKQIMFLMYVIGLLVLLLFLLGYCYIGHGRMKGKVNKKTQVMAAHRLEMMQNVCHNEGSQD